MAAINIVLVEPEIPQNTGSIARTCAVTGAALHLVKPMGFEITDTKLKRAGLDYWDKLDITYYDSLENFLSKNTDACKYFFSTKAKHCYTDIEYPDKVYLIFGKESRGLPEDLLYNNPEYCVRIPMRKTLRSLNLSNSVSIGIYEVLRQRGFSDLEEEGQLTKYEW